jgi:hypothetical protein
MKIKKSTVVFLIVIAILGIFAFWFIGWESIRYDRMDKAIGSKIIFTVPMLYVSNIPNTVAGEFVASKYGAVISDADSWKDSAEWFPHVKSHTIDNADVFLVEEVFYIERYGFLKRVFSQDLKLYVLSSPNYKSAAILGETYEANSISTASVVNSGSLSPVE